MRNPKVDIDTYRHKNASSVTLPRACTPSLFQHASNSLISRSEHMAWMQRVIEKIMLVLSSVRKKFNRSMSERQTNSAEIRKSEQDYLAGSKSNGA